MGRHPHAQLNLLTRVSDIHIESKFSSNRDKILDIFCDKIKFGRSVGFKKILVYLEDGTRTDLSYLKELVLAFTGSGAKIISIPDTVGFVNDPEKYGEIFSRLLGELSLPEKTVLSAHTHNDKGLAVANALAAVRHGAGMVECTVNGLGERAGNASMGAILMSLHPDDPGCWASTDYGVSTSLRLEEYGRTAVLVGELGGMGLHPNEPLVGESVFTTAAGIHQDGVMKNQNTYICLRPERFGVDVSNRLITFNVQSGVKGIMKTLSDMGLVVDKDQAQKVYDQVILLAQQKTPSKEDLRVIAMEVLESHDSIVELKVCKSQSGVFPCSSEVVLRLTSENRVLRGIGYGDGPFAAFMDIVCELLHLNANILDYHDIVVGQGREAQMQCFIRCTIGSGTYNGRGVSTDLVQAGCRAFMKCVNDHLQES
ncbi:MAG: hypothetical protein HQL31_13370 [Planctomycetes bacterium]|nr:hypothetical protein [Planctomycetota bacterium]